MLAMDDYGQAIAPYHFRVTWPFWTFFMLNPTVGIELRVELHVSRKRLGQNKFIFG